MRSLRFFVVFVVLLGSFAMLAASASKLPKRHQDWLTGPVSYLITKTEREAFLNLKTDEERDRFIDRFWEIRNPAPGTGQNEFKDEFYRRLEYANAHFGRYNGTEGWRSAMGKTWILFGKPQTNMNYVANQELHPVELWFYSNPGLAELPPFFYVMFFERDDISGYSLYQPYVDGPDKLLKAGGTKAQAYQYLRNISAELAHASLSLIPGEPVDTDTFSGSMESVIITNAIQGYREMPSYIAMVQARAARLERVTSRIVYDVAKAALLTLVARDQGEPWLHWRIEISDPMQPKVKNGQVGYEISARLYSHSRLVFERTDSPSFAAPQDGAEALKSRPFAYEDRMPVVAGAYRLAVTAKNRATGKVYEASRDVSVPAANDFSVSDLIVIGRVESEARTRPLQFGGVKFFPAIGGRVHAATGLRVLYQVTAAQQPRPSELEVEYVVGTVATKFRKVYQDRLDMSRADAGGSLVTAKSLPIEELSPGSYQMAIRVKDPQSSKVVAQSGGFTVLATEQDPSPIVISRANIATSQWLAISQYERALCWLSQDRPSEAVASLEASWKLDHNPVTRGLLEHLYERTGQKKALN